MTVRRTASVVLLSTMAVALTACGATVSETFSSVGESLDSPSPATSSPSSPETASPSEAAEADGTLTIVDLGGPIDGPGVSVADAVANVTGDPNIVNGILLKDLDGVIWLCDELADTSPPSCGEPRLRVLEYPEGGAEWDLETGELVGLQEEDGVLWIEDTQNYGVVEP
jgi:hypothetical protein